MGWTFTGWQAFDQFLRPGPPGNLHHFEIDFVKGSSGSELLSMHRFAKQSNTEKPQMQL